MEGFARVFFLRRNTYASLEKEPSLLYKTPANIEVLSGEMGPSFGLFETGSFEQCIPVIDAISMAPMINAYMISYKILLVVL